MPHADRLALALTSGALPVPETGPILVLNAEPGGWVEALPGERLRAEQPLRPPHDALAARGVDVSVRDDGPAALVIVMVPRSRVEGLGLVARALAALSPEGRLAIDGARTDGIDGLVKHVAAAIPIEEAFVKAHGRTVWLTRPETLPPVVAAWAEAAAPQRNAAGMLAAAGMFSSDAADPGSLRLADALDSHVKGRVADLGAGWGWLAQAALDRCPKIAQIDLYDADARALDAARANVTDPRASFHWADVTALGRDVPQYDTVIMNPPFHQGRAAEVSLGRSFIATAARILKPQGRLFLVANRQLAYEQELAARFRHVDRRSEDAGYKVVVAAHPLRRR